MLVTLEDPSSKLVTAKGTVEGFVRVVAEPSPSEAPATGGSLVRFTAPTLVAGPLPSTASPRGFVLKVPITATDAVFVGYDSSITTAGLTRGFPIEPDGEFVSELGNTGLLYVIAASAVEIVALVET
jgi:hypothetical protein